MDPLAFSYGSEGRMQHLLQSSENLVGKANAAHKRIKDATASLSPDESGFLSLAHIHHDQYSITLHAVA